MGRWYLGRLALLVAITLGGCGGPTGPFSGTVPLEEAGDVPALGVSNPFLVAVVKELAGEDVALLALAEPGMCPGHFDLRPSQVRQARHCRLLIRFDFQQSLDARLTGPGSRPPRIVGVHVSGGLCEPASYLEAARQVAETLVGEQLVSRAEADARLAAAAGRMAELDAWARAQIEAAGLTGAPVLASGHQAAFCRALGLNVVGTFPTADTSVPSEMEDAVQEGRQGGVQWIIANLPQGRQAADALADRFAAKVVVFGNFPDGQGADSFDRLVRDNVTSLVKAVEP